MNDCIYSGEFGHTKCVPVFAYAIISTLEMLIFTMHMRMLEKTDLLNACRRREGLKNPRPYVVLEWSLFLFSLKFKLGVELKSFSLNSLNGKAHTHIHTAT